MGENNISIPSFEMPLNMAIQRSLSETLERYDTAGQVPQAVIQQSFENNLRSEYTNWSRGLVGGNDPIYGSGVSQGFNSGPGPGKGLGITFGLKITLDAKIRFNANVGVGYGFQGKNASGAATMHFNIYNNGLGTRARENNIVYDVTASAYLIGGVGQGSPMPNYLLNYNTRSPFSDQHKFSLMYGQSLTWNSELNHGRFSFEDIQRQGLLGLRLGNAAKFSTNNDTDVFPYFGGGTDEGWTGGLILHTPLFELGYQNFTGRGTAFDGTPGPVAGTKYGGTMYQQDSWSKSLNKASTFLRFNTGVNSDLTLDLFGDGWFQNWIHERMDNPKFEYQNFWDK